jgi:hypothetical protein
MRFAHLTVRMGWKFVRQTLVILPTTICTAIRIIHATDPVFTISDENCALDA